MNPVVNPVLVDVFLWAGILYFTVGIIETLLYWFRDR